MGQKTEAAGGAAPARVRRGDARWGGAERARVPEGQGGKE